LKHVKSALEQYFLKTLNDSVISQWTGFCN